jgi:hypothetical protein
VANDHTRVLLVTPATKQAAARLLANDPEPVQYVLMAVLTYLAVLHELDHFSSITLDQDYSGDLAERRVLRRLLKMLRRDRPKLKASALRMENNVAGSHGRSTRANGLPRTAENRMGKSRWRRSWQYFEAKKIGLG